MKHTPKPATTPQREALRAAIQRRTDLQAKIAELEATLADQTEKKYAAYYVTEAAEAALTLGNQMRRKTMSGALSEKSRSRR